MKVDSDIVCRLEPYGPVCEWKGDQRHGTALVFGDMLFRAREEGRYDPETKILKVGSLRLLVLGQRGENGIAWDSWYVKLDNPHSQLYALYREKVEKLLRLVMRFEAAVLAFQFQSIEGREAKFTQRLAAKLL